MTSLPSRDRVGRTVMPQGDVEKLAIIGASAFQNPLILKAKEMGVETHVFAWQSGDVGERTADFFYPISIMEAEEILVKCREIGIDGIASIGSDLANKTVAYVADAMGLTCNTLGSVERSTNKDAMRRTFEEFGDPSPKSVLVDDACDLSLLDLEYPLIVKPLDRSGSRGITKLDSGEGLADAVASAIDVSFAKAALIEEFVQGDEYSVEAVSWEGVHRILAITEKFTTGSPGFIETGHLEPARISAGRREAIEGVVLSALDHLGVDFGASHSEVKVDGSGNVKIIEIGSRMGGDCIGSDLVRLSTGYDFVEAVVDIALGRQPKEFDPDNVNVAAIRFVFGDDDRHVLDSLRLERPDLISFVSDVDDADHDITDSSTRLGYFIFSGPTMGDVEPYLPRMEK